MRANPGRELRRLRVRKKLTFRDVQRLSEIVADDLRNPAFRVSISRLHDLENGRGAPTIYRLYTLAHLYGCRVGRILEAYGVPRL